MVLETVVGQVDLLHRIAGRVDPDGRLDVAGAEITVGQTEVLGPALDVDGCSLGLCLALGRMVEKQATVKPLVGVRADLAGLTDVGALDAREVPVGKDEAVGVGRAVAEGAAVPPIHLRCLVVDSGDPVVTADIEVVERVPAAGKQNAVAELGVRPGQENAAVGGTALDLEVAQGTVGGVGHVDDRPRLHGSVEEGPVACADQVKIGIGARFPVQLPVFLPRLGMVVHACQFEGLVEPVTTLGDVDRAPDSRLQGINRGLDGRVSRWRQ